MLKENNSNFSQKFYYIEYALIYKLFINIGIKSFKIANDHESIPIYKRFNKFKYYYSSRFGDLCLYLYSCIDRCTLISFKYIFFYIVKN